MREKGEANLKPSTAAPDVKSVEQEAIKTQMEELAKADDTKLKAGQVKEVTVNMGTKAVAKVMFRRRKLLQSKRRRKA